MSSTIGQRGKMTLVRYLLSLGALLLAFVVADEIPQKAEECHALKTKVVLAGFKPDGYYERARDRIQRDLITVVDPVFKLFENRKEFLAWRATLPGVAETFSSSTIFFVENPFQVLGDSDAIEEYYMDCYGDYRGKKASCGDVRVYFKERLDHLEEEKKNVVAEHAPWEHEAQQGLNCPATRAMRDSSNFHLILNREWNKQSFESFSAAIVQNKLNLAPIEKGPFGTHMIKVEGILPGPQSPDEIKYVLQRGTISTNGENLLVALKTIPIPPKDDPVLSKYTRFGFIPEGSLKRTFDQWDKFGTLNVTIDHCTFLHGGLKRVQNILATDMLDTSKMQ